MKQPNNKQAKTREQVDERALKNRFLAQGLQEAGLRQELEARRHLVRKGRQEAKGKSKMSVPLR